MASNVAVLRSGLSESVRSASFHLAPAPRPRPQSQLLSLKIRLSNCGLKIANCDPSSPPRPQANRSTYNALRTPTPRVRNVGASQAPGPDSPLVFALRHIPPLRPEADISRRCVRPTVFLHRPPPAALRLPCRLPGRAARADDRGGRVGKSVERAVRLDEREGGRVFPAVYL